MLVARMEDVRGQRPMRRSSRKKWMIRRERRQKVGWLVLVLGSKVGGEVGNRVDDVVGVVRREGCMLAAKLYLQPESASAAR